MIKPDIQIGDLITTKKWVGPKFLEYSHSGIVVKEPYWSKVRERYMIDVVDYLNQGGGISHVVYSGLGKNEVRIVRLKTIVENKNEIIKIVVKIALKVATLPKLEYCFIPRQFVRVLLKKCFVKNPSFEEVERYYQGLKGFLENKQETPNIQLNMFCSRFALLIYQIAILMIYDGDTQQLKPCFRFQPMYCRPEHVSQLGQNSKTKSCWEKVDLTGFERFWFRGDDRFIDKNK